MWRAAKHCRASAVEAVSICSKKNSRTPYVQPHRILRCAASFATSPCRPSTEQAVAAGSNISDGAPADSSTTPSPAAVTPDLLCTLEGLFSTAQEHIDAAPFSAMTAFLEHEPSERQPYLSYQQRYGKWALEAIVEALEWYDRVKGNMDRLAAGAGDVSGLPAARSRAGGTIPILAAGGTEGGLGTAGQCRAGARGQFGGTGSQLEAMGRRSSSRKGPAPCPAGRVPRAAHTG